MPVFEYECLDCGEKYEIFHFTKEKTEDIICPKCGSVKANKFLSTFSPKVSAPVQHHSHNTPAPCASCCHAPSCGMNYH
jgi:putative FmdB family regulatory protein